MQMYCTYLVVQDQHLIREVGAVVEQYGGAGREGKSQVIPRALGTNQTHLTPKDRLSQSKISMCH